MGHKVEILPLRDKFHGRYRVFWVESSDKGCAGYELYENSDTAGLCVCSVMFCDAVGQYFVHLPGGDIRAADLMKLIFETVKRVGVPFDYAILE